MSPSQSRPRQLAVPGRAADALYSVACMEESKETPPPDAWRTANPSFAQVKTAETDGYNAVQVGYQKVNDNKLNKPEMGHIQKAGVAPMKHLKEFRVRGFAERNASLVHLTHVRRRSAAILTVALHSAAGIC